MTKLSKVEIIQLLHGIASLHEFHGESPFKSRAYENAARSLAEDQSTLDDLLREPKRLESLPGIGASIAGVIREAAENGESRLLEKLRAGTPAGLYQLMQIPKLGPKKIQTLYNQLGIASVEELEQACKDGSIAKLPKFGERSAEKILEGIEQYRRFAGKWLYHRALRQIEPFVDAIAKCSSVRQVEIAGALRRKCEILQDVVLVANASDAAEAVECFATHPNVARVQARDEKSASIVLSTGMPVHLHVADGDEFVSALHHFTGSKGHIERLNELAEKEGLRLTESGIAHTASKLEARIPIADEAAIYALLKLEFVPTELRENLGEIEAAEKHELPELISMRDYVGVLHCHSTWSDGSSSIRDLATTARDVYGWKYLGICDHSPTASYAGGVRPDDLLRQQEEIDELNEEFAGSGFKVLKGCESDILADGSLDYPDELLEKMDVIVASVHSRFQMNEKEMTERLVRATQNPYTSIIGHISGRILLGRDPYRFDLDAVLEAAAETGTIIELNADPFRLDIDWRYCRRAKEVGVSFAINPDAHSITDLRFTEVGINVARKGWLTRDNVVNCMSCEALLQRMRDLRESKKSRSD